VRLTGERLRLGDDKGRSNPWRMLVYLVLIVVGIVLLRMVNSGQVQPPFLPTPGPTRTAGSYAEEAEIHFAAGDLEQAIQAYATAAELELDDSALWGKLARVQCYSSDLLTTIDLRRERLAQARASIEKAVEANPESAFAHAVRTLVYDWSASAETRDSIGVGDVVRVQASLGEGGLILADVIELIDAFAAEDLQENVNDQTAVLFSGEVESVSPDAWVVAGRTVRIHSETVVRNPNRREAFLTEAETSALRARQLDPDDGLALAFYAEVLVDQQRFAQALDLARLAVESADTVAEPYRMDIHRVYGTVLENHGLYMRAVEEYRKAVEISPNLTFLYLRIGVNYRTLRDIESALGYFEKAARTNEQLGIDDPTPYLAIGKTYLQEGEFFIAAINIERALAIDPTNADFYGRLGIVYFKARNYESAIPVLRCALEGCSAQETAQLICDLAFAACEDGAPVDVEPKAVVGLPLGPNSLEYYYTYGSVLAAYGGHPAYPDACERAEAVFRALMSKYGDDPIVTEIVAEGRLICASPSPPPQPFPTSTAMPSESS
jgi:tetratricopeptide (TPR) repeat protein